MSKFDYRPEDGRPVRLDTTRDEWDLLHRAAYDTRGKVAHIPKVALQNLLKDQAALIHYHKGEVKEAPE